MKLISILTIVFCVSISAFSQEKIGNKIYKYGDVTESIQGRTLIAFEEADAELKNKTVQYFQNKDIDAESWSSIFLPGTEYSEEEFSSALSENQINTLAIIEVINISESTSSYNSSSAYASTFGTWNSITYGRTVTYASGVSLRLTIFTDEDQFSKPLCVIDGKAYNNLGEIGFATSTSLTRRIVRRMLNSMEEEDAF